MIEQSGVYALTISNSPGQVELQIILRFLNPGLVHRVKEIILRPLDLFSIGNSKPGLQHSSYRLNSTGLTSPVNRAQIGALYFVHNLVNRNYEVNDY
jgi:hypothetical protein